MPIDLANAAETIREIRKRAEDQRSKSLNMLGDVLSRGERKPPGDYGDSSYLLVRSTPQDNGNRPLANGAVFWLSPDIRIRPLSGSGSYTTTLEAGRAYDVEVLVGNRGDLPVPSAKVELYLTDPTLGFDTRFATRIGVGSTWVPGTGSGKVNVPYIVPSNIAGHKCMFARVFSFSPLDLPLEDTSLDPTLDRHVAQLNLTIVDGGSPTPLIVNVVHQPNFQGTIAFKPATLQQLLATAHPILGEKRFVENERLPALMTRAARFEPLGGSAGSIKLEGDGRVIHITSEGDGPSLEEQKHARDDLLKAMRAIAAFGAAPSKFKDIFTAYRKLQTHAVMHRLELRLPETGVEAGETAAVHLEAASRWGNTLGGVTILFEG